MEGTPIREDHDPITPNVAQLAPGLLILPNTNVKLTYLTDEVSRSKSEVCVLSDNRRVVQISWLQLALLQS